MIADIHSHYIPLESSMVAAENGKRHKLTLAQNERGRDVVFPDGKPYLGALKAEFYDLELRAAMMEQQGDDMQTLSATASYLFLLDGLGRNSRIYPLADRRLRRDPEL